MRTLAILGDSYSTFRGWVPEGQDIYYPCEPLGVTDVAHTWWHVLCEKEGLTLLKNDSWSGSTVCTTVRPEHPTRAAFVRRMEASLNGEAQPDIIVIFGGTNDSWIDCPIGENRFSHWDEETDRQVLPAFCHLLGYVQQHNPAAQILAVVNTELKEEITSGMQSACAHMGVTCVMLHDIHKEWIHPTALGMRQIAQQIGVHLHP